MKSPDLPLSRKPKAKAALCAAMPGTMRQLMAATGTAKQTVQAHLIHLHDARRIYISAWQLDKISHALAVYAVGDDMPDAPRPVLVNKRKEAHARLLVKKALALSAARIVVQRDPVHEAVRAQGRVFALAGAWA